MVIKREEKAPRVASYDEAMDQVHAWAHDSALEICAGPRLAILKTKILVQDLRTDRIGQIIFDEARDLDRPMAKSLRQIEIEYKGQAEAEPDDDFESVASSMLAISQRIKAIFPGLKYTKASKFKHFRHS